MDKFARLIEEARGLNGMIAEISGPQFLYTEDNVKDWREGFAILEFKDGELLPPELVLRCETKPDSILFKGKIVRVP